MYNQCGEEYLLYLYMWLNVDLNVDIFQYGDQSHDLRYRNTKKTKTLTKFTTCIGFCNILEWLDLGTFVVSKYNFGNKIKSKEHSCYVGQSSMNEQISYLLLQPILFVLICQDRINCYVLCAHMKQLLSMCGWLANIIPTYFATDIMRYTHKTQGLKI